MFRRRNTSLPAGFGLALFLLGFPVLWFNEGSAVRDRAAIVIMEREATVTGTGTIDPAKDGQIIVLSGVPVATDAPLSDPDLGFSLDALRLRRTVEMYQFIVRKDPKVKDRITTELGWSADQETSDDPTAGQFRNPPMPFRSAEISAQSANAGPYRLSSPLIDRMAWYEPVDPGRLDITLDRPTRVEGEYLHIKADPDGTTPLANQIGDLRIKIDMVPVQPVSLIARQDGNLLSVPTIDGVPGYAVVKPGTLGKSALIAAARSDVNVRTMVTRLLGLAAMIIGLRIVLRRTTGILLRVPLFGGALGAGIWVVAALAGLTIGFVTIALAWFAYRPLLSVSLLALAGAALALEVFVLRKTRRTRADMQNMAPDRG